MYNPKDISGIGLGVEHPPPKYTMYDIPLEQPKNPVLWAMQHQQTFQLQQKITNRIPWELKPTRFRNQLFIFAFLGAIYLLYLIGNESYTMMIQANKFDIFLSIDLTGNFTNLSILQIVFLTIAVILVSLIFGLVQLMLMLFVFKLFIFGAIVLSCSIGTFTMIYFYNEKQWWHFIGSCVFTLLILFFSWKMHNRVTFSIALIKLGSKMIRTNPCIWLVYIGMILVNSVAATVYFFVVYCVVSITDTSTERDQVYKTYLLLLFIGLYVNDVIQNSVQMIVGAICSKWYFKSKVGTGKAIYNTFIKCFGSICLGSLLATIITVLKEVFVLVKPNEHMTNFTLLKPFWKLIEYILFALNFAIRYFNEYSFAYMAIYSKGYIKSSFRMFKIYNFKGYDTLINDSIIKIILRLYMLLSGILGGLTAAWCIQLFEPSSFSAGHSGIKWLLIVMSGFLALQVSRTLSIIINGFVHVLLICLVEHQDVLREEHVNDAEFRVVQTYLTPYPVYSV